MKLADYIVDYYIPMNIPELIDELLKRYAELLEKDPGGQYRKEEWQAMTRLITTIAPPLPNIPKPLYTPVMSRNVPTNVELVIVRNGKVLLTKRKWFREDAYHTPGTFIAPGETYLQAASRCAKAELGEQLLVHSTHKIETVNLVSYADNPQFHRVAILLECKISGEPSDGEWFCEKPPMLNIQRGYWQLIEPLLKK